MSRPSFSAVVLACLCSGLDGARLESTSAKSYVDPVYSRQAFDPLLVVILAESRMLDGGAGVTGVEVESLRFCWRFDRRRGGSFNSS